MIICGKEFSPDTIGMIRDIIEKDQQISRTQLSRQVCEILDWRSPNGSLKDMSCRVGLLKLHRKGIIDLPQAYERPDFITRKNTDNKTTAYTPGIECELSGLGEIKIVRIHSRYSKIYEIWKEMMGRHHYLGSGSLCGHQMKYMIESERYGYLGGFAFSSAAWRLEARDSWVGWDDKIRSVNLNKVVCNSRFLIAPYVKVRNLASHSLAICVKQLEEDWYGEYRIKPVLLETFVDKQLGFDGASYKASNWIHVGSTKGRGRQDRSNEFDVSPKDIYLYPLDKECMKELCNGVAKITVMPTPPADWAEEEFLGADLGDYRRVKRLTTIARDFYARPQGNIPQACGSRAKTKAAYRFFEDKNNTMEKIHKSHYEATVNRIKNEKVILAVQDTTTLNYSAHLATEDLGLIGSKQEGLIGLIVHDTMAFNVEGTPLGIMDVQSWARDPADFGKKHLRHQYSVEQKESYKWIKSFNAVTEAQKRCLGATLVSIGDREADIYELFHLALSEPENPKLLVRAEHNRLLADGQGKLYEHISSQELAGIQRIRVPRKNKQPAREAELEIRFSRVKLKPPRGKCELGELTIFSVIAEEVNIPTEVEGLKWVLLTTCEVKTFEQAIEKLQWYCLRWGIEIYHRTLKSGCKIEMRQLGSADRTESCLAIDMVVAWRICHLTKLGREAPDVPCTVFSEEAEWKAIVAYKTKIPIPPDETPTLRETIHMVASLGGFLGRKSDGEPGTQT